MRDRCSEEQWQKMLDERRKIELNKRRRRRRRRRSVERELEGGKVVKRKAKSKHWKEDQKEIGKKQSERRRRLDTEGEGEEERQKGGKKLLRIESKREKKCICQTEWQKRSSICSTST